MNKLRTKLKDCTNEFKEVLKEIRIGHTASFFAGVFSSIFFYWFWIGKDITASGVSAFIAATGLAFSAYIAFKVKKWSLIKINERGFKHTEEIIANLVELYKIINSTYTPLINILHSQTEDSSRQHCKILIKNKAEIKRITNEIHGLSITLKLWKVEMTEEFEKNIDDIHDHLTTFNLKSDQLLTGPLLYRKLPKECKIILDNCNDNYGVIFNKEHKNWFVFS